MIVTADEVSRSFRGAVDLLHRRVEGLKSFDMTEAGFWRSFSAIWLTLPAFVIAVALERSRAGLPLGASPLIGLDGITLAVAAGQISLFLALPLAMIGVARRLELGGRYVPFVIVTNWLIAIALLVLSVPAFLLVVGWAMPGHAAFFGLAFSILLAQAHWFATKATLQVSGGIAALIVALAGGLYALIAGTVDALAL
ncbi:MAG TPA: hypothetical protein VIL65_15070 [Beijerinckiaceae bacterium]|jgi:hypothetical protein